MGYHHWIKCGLPSALHCYWHEYWYLWWDRPHHQGIFNRFFHPGRKIELNRGFWNRKILCFPIIISRQFAWKYWYVFGLCIDTVLLAFILSFIDVSVNRRSPNTHTCMTKVKQIYIRVWRRKSRCTFVYDWRKGDIHTYMTEEKQIYKLLLYAK